MLWKKSGSSRLRLVDPMICWSLHVSSMPATPWCRISVIRRVEFVSAMVPYLRSVWHLSWFCHHGSSWCESYWQDLRKYQWSFHLISSYAFGSFSLGVYHSGEPPSSVQLEDMSSTTITLEGTPSVRICGDESVSSSNDRPKFDPGLWMRQAVDFFDLRNRDQQLRNMLRTVTGLYWKFTAHICWLPGCQLDHWTSVALGSRRIWCPSEARSPHPSASQAKHSRIHRET